MTKTIMNKCFAIVLAVIMTVPVFAMASVSTFAAEAVALDEATFPDEIFRTYLAENYDKNSDGTLSESEIEGIKELQISNMGISSLEGVSYLTELEALICDNNKLTGLGLSYNKKLVTLNCSNNQLEKLAVIHCASLSKLDCSNNQLTSLDLSNNYGLMSPSPNTLKMGNNPWLSIITGEITSITNYYFGEILPYVTEEDSVNLTKKEINSGQIRNLQGGVIQNAGYGEQEIVPNSYPGTVTYEYACDYINWGITFNATIEFTGDGPEQVEEPEATPEAEEPEATPEAEEPEAAPEVEEPEPTPEVSEPEAAPEVEEPEAAPEVEEPEAAPEVDEPEAAPEVDEPVVDTDKETAAMKEEPVVFPIDKVTGPYVQGSGEDWSLRGHGEFEDFEAVKVDGEVVDEQAYTVTEGSTIITFAAAYLDSLEPGSHEVEMIWKTGTASVEVEIEETVVEETPIEDDEKAPATGDAESLLIWLLLAATGGIVLKRKMVR